MGLREAHWEENGGVDFRVLLRRGGREEELFFESFVPAEVGAPKWIDREVPVPGTASAPFSITLETGLGPDGANTYDHAGWSHPRLVCRGSVELPVRDPDRPPIVLISIDTLRQDHLGLYGYPRPTSPTLDAFAREALVFDACFAPAPYTLPSHGTLLTGLPPQRHRAGFDFPEAPLDRRVPTLPALLGEAGYRTVALTAGGLVSYKFGLQRGFGEWRELQRASLRSVLPAVFDLLDDEPRRPLFLFLHTYDVHGPYQQPAEYRHFTGEPGMAVEAGGEGSEILEQIRETKYHRYQKLERFHSVGAVRAAYDSSIRFVDAQLSRIFDHLRELDLYDRAVIVVTSDHGESLFEAGRYFGHSYTFDDREVKVPLLLRLPGGATVGRRSGMVDLGDVTPTLLRLAGVEVPEEIADRGLLAPRVGRKVVAGGSSHLGSIYLRTERWKLVSPTNAHWRTRVERLFGPTTDRFPLGWQLYDLQADPAEERNLTGLEQLPPEVYELMAMKRREPLPGTETGRRDRDLDPETEAQLRALGYVE
jgi:arylsulfatase